MTKKANITKTSKKSEPEQPLQLDLLQKALELVRAAGIHRKQIRPSVTLPTGRRELALDSKR